MTTTRAPDEVLAEVPKNKREIIRVARSEFNGRPLLDVRVWLPGVLPTLPATPTRKGLSLPAATWRLLLPEIAAAVADEEGETP